jgi:hypothetical protein
MADLVAGLGEIGMPIYQLLKDRNFKVDGFDPAIDEFSQPLFDKSYDMIHICFPFDEEFENHIKPYLTMTDKLVIHSTVIPGTSKQFGAIYSPIRGIHNNMDEHIRWFSKYYAYPSEVPEFEKRFPHCQYVEDQTKLERTKVVDTSYYGLLIAFRKYIDENHPIYWHFENELHQMFGNRPILFNDSNPIGGHCVIENLDLLGDKFLKDFVGQYGK